MKRRAWIGVVAVVALVAGVFFLRPRSTPPVPPDFPTQDLDAEVRDVLEEARSAVVASPRSAEAWGRLGMLFRAHGMDAASNVCFREAEKLDPKDSRWPYLFAIEALFRDPDNALGPLRRAVELGHDDPAYASAARLRLAEALLERMRYDEAEALFRDEAKADPTSARARVGLGLVCMARDDLRGAIGHLEGLGTSPFARKKAAITLALAYRRLGNVDAAAKVEQDATRLPPDLLWSDSYVGECARLERGRLSRFDRVVQFESQGRFADAVKLLTEMAQEHPDTRTYIALGITLAKDQKYAAAEQVLREVVKLDPDHVQARYFLCASLFYQGESLWNDASRRNEATERFRSSITEAEQAIRCKPDHALAHLFRGRALGYLGETDEGIASLRRALACRPDLYETHFYLGDALATAGRPREALPHLEAAVRLAGDRDPKPRQRLEQARGK
jgi:tetratricopeptide (TPR) repeat protein